MLNQRNCITSLNGWAIQTAQSCLIKEVKMLRFFTTLKIKNGSIKKIVHVTKRF